KESGLVSRALGGRTGALHAIYLELFRVERKLVSRGGVHPHFRGIDRFGPPPHPVTTPIGNESCGVRFVMPMTRHCVLIVDDEPDVCDSVQDLLRREFRVLKAHSAEVVYRMMQEEEVHIVMSDQRMPQITGIELLTKLKARHPHAIRMLFTG